MSFFISAGTANRQESDIFVSLVPSIHFAILDFVIASREMDKFDGGYRKLTRTKLG